MILQLFIVLLLIAAASILITQGRRKRIWSIFILAILGVTSYFFAQDTDINTQNDFIYQWLSYNNLKADIHISTSIKLQQLFFAMIFLLSGLVYLNTISSFEQHSLYINTLLVLNFIGFILLVSSQDFLQLMFASSIFSVVGFYMPDQVIPKKKIFVFNFLSEMSVFMALAVIYGKINSINLADLSLFIKNGRHQDLVVSLLMFSIGCKCGLFLLNGQYFNLKSVSFNRLIGIMLLSAPLSGLVLMAKFHPLLAASSLVASFFPKWLLLSIVSSLMCALINNSLKSKAVSLILSLYSFTLLMTYHNVSIIYQLIPLTLSASLLGGMLLFISFNSASEENDISFLGGMWRITKYNFSLSLFMVSAIISVLLRISSVEYSIVFASIYIMVLAIILRMIYYGHFRGNEISSAYIVNTGILYWFPLLVISVFLIYNSNVWKHYNFILLSSMFIFVWFLFPSTYLLKLGQYPLWQTDILSRIYDIFLLSPLRFIGRFLWLAFDIVVIERSIIASISHTTRLIVAGVHRIQETGKWSYILSIFIGIFIMLIYLGVYVNE